MEDKPSDLRTKSEVEDIAPASESKATGGGWGGWGFTPLSYLADLQKAATVAAEEISRNAVEAARTAAQTFSDNMIEDSESLEENESKSSAVTEEESDDESSERRRAALDKLENASEDSFLSQGLKALDTSVDSITSGAWQALGTALKGGANLVHKIENSASTFSESIQQSGLPRPPGSGAQSLMETGKAFTTKGMQVLELVGREAIDLLISETGIEIDKNTKISQDKEEDQMFEEVTFERCFYIYGGPEQLEELEALSNHYALLYNRRKGKLSSEQKSNSDWKLKEVQHIFDLDAEIDGYRSELEKGKKIDAENDDIIDELKNLHDSSVRKAAELAAGFAGALAGLSPNDVIQRTSGRLDSLQSEGVHRLSEMCCFAVTQLLMLGKSIISSANKVQDQEIDEQTLKIDWPEDSVEKAKIIRVKTESLTGNIEVVFNSFITGISDVKEAYLAAIKNATGDSPEITPKSTILEKAKLFTEHLRADHSTAVERMKDGLQYLAYVILCSSIPAA